MKLAKGLLAAFGFVLFSILLLVGNGRGLIEDAWNLPPDSFRFRLYDSLFVKHKIATLSVFCTYGFLVVVSFWKEVRESAFQADGVSASYFRVMIALALILIVVLTVFGN